MTNQLRDLPTLEERKKAMKWVCSYRRGGKFEFGFKIAVGEPDAGGKLKKILFRTSSQETGRIPASSLGPAAFKAFHLLKREIKVRGLTIGVDRSKKN